MNARSCLRAARGLLAVALLGVLTPWSAGAREAVRAGRGEITLPTYPWWPPIKHPYFRGTDNRNIYPYPMLDQLRREKAPRTYQTVTLENEYLRVTLLPELGGKVHEVISKVTGQPVFYVNHVVKPGLIGQCGAWISGGIEWNTGPQGHTVSCLQPVDVQVLPAEADGSRSVAIGETERIYRTKWTVVLTLRPGRSFLEERIRIYNPTETVRPYYFWNCTAAPNTPGFRFVYPMTLGTDHGGTQFYAWPIHEGKDLRQGTNYQDASSIFAYGCDQDFFGSYNDDLRRGVVAYANHHQLPGKKAWTWGWGSYGTMHQMDLTDDDGPYNEVQTGPLLTQADVGQLDPGEAVAWREWWYPVHELGGFTYANRDLAVNAEPEAGRYRLRFLGTGTWSPVTVTLSNANYTVARNLGRISPRQPTELKVDVPGDPGPIWVSVDCRGSSLARFRVPLDLPTPTKPEPTAPPASASGLARSGWQDFLFARFAEAETRFRDATAKDPAAVEAWTGLAHLRLDADPAQAAAHARTALSHNPDDGPARFALAVAEFRQHRETEALEAAWRAALDPRTAVPGRALAAKILIRQQHYASAIAALSESGPWTHDNLCRNRLAFAQLAAGNQREAVRLASQSLAEDPLDAFAQSLLATLKPKGSGKTAPAFARIEPATALDLAAEYSELGAPATALRVLTEGYVGIRWEGRTLDPLPFYWAGYLASRLGQEAQALQWLQKARAQRPDGVFPHHYEAVPVLEYALARQPDDAQAALLLGHLLFHLGRYAPAQAHWEQAAAGNAAQDREAVLSSEN